MVPWRRSELMTIKVGLIDLILTGSDTRDRLVWDKGQIGSVWGQCWHGVLDSSLTWVIRWGRRQGASDCSHPSLNATEFQLPLSVYLTGAIREIFTASQCKMATIYLGGVDGVADKYQWLHDYITRCWPFYCCLFGKKNVLPMGISWCSQPSTCPQNHISNPSCSHLPLLF